MYRLSSMYTLRLLPRRQQAAATAAAVSTLSPVTGSLLKLSPRVLEQRCSMRGLCAAASSKGGGGDGNRGRGGRPPGLPPPPPPPPSKNNTDKKRNNLDKKLFQPAQKGQLQHNKNFIPKSVARKPKANIADMQKRPHNMKQRFWKEEGDLAEGERQQSLMLPGAAARMPPMTRRSADYQAMSELEYENESVSDEQAISMLAYELDHDDDHDSYWSESYFEEKNFFEEQYTGKNPPGYDLDAELQKYEPTPAEAAAAAARNKRKKSDLEEEMEGGNADTDERDSKFYKEFLEDDDWIDGEGESFIDSLKTEQEKKEALDHYKYTVVESAKIGGYDLVGINPETFLPTQYQVLIKENPHPDAAREPKPYFSPDRRQPSREFVEGHRRFLYVTGLPRFEMDGAPADLDNPVHWSMMQKIYVRLLGVESKQVSPANSYSAFVGFHSPEDRASLLFSGPTEKFLSSAPSFQRYMGKYKFANECTLLLIDIPPGNTSVSILGKLFPEGTEIHSVYGASRTPDDVKFISSRKALIRFSSIEEAESILESTLVSAQLEEIGKYRVQFMRARRELVHDRFGGPAGDEELRKLGPRLIVDGDMPSRAFYTRHASTLFLRNLDPSLSKEEITRAFQPFCAMPRDKNKSIEFVTCWEDIPVGQAYVGFDLPDEAEAALKGLGPIVRMGDRKTQLSLVKLRLAPFQKYKGPDKRPERPIEELLKDLSGWEQYVDPADIKLLEDNGVSKQVLDDAMRNIRFNNHTFSVFDQSIRDEALEPDKDFGQQYKDIVQLFIKTLIDCLPTKENPGLMYEHQFFPGQEIDLSIFDKEKDRQELIRQHRAR